MAAPKKNSNAQKWTKEIVLDYLAQIEATAQDRRNVFLGQVLEGLGLYRDLWRYWCRRFGGIEEIGYRMELIEQLFERNVFESAIVGELPARVAIVCLKFAHGWREEPVSSSPVLLSRNDRDKRGRSEETAFDDEGLLRCA